MGVRINRPIGVFRRFIRLGRICPAQEFGVEWFVLMPIKIVDLARDLIELSGKEVGQDIEIVFTGLRPGEIQAACGGRLKAKFNCLYSL